MRAILLALVVLGSVLAIANVAPTASATCTSPTQVGCVCIPVYYGGQGIHGGFVWRCITDGVLP
ncbi:MAG: hypothetical protein QOE90_2184 [Thermoplasmata archaeon]|jgi:hypothetical protein|nr:hypothetical protein [Thermoplasmata archaeon]